MLTEIKTKFSALCRRLAAMSEFKPVEESLQESQERYKRLLEAVTDYIYTVEIERGQAVSTTHSPGCVAVTGYTSQDYEIDPNLWYRMIYETDRPRVMEQIAKVLAGEDIAPFEHRILHRDGTIRWVKNTWVPRYDEAGHLIAYDGLIADVTERKQAEQALRQSESRLEAIISTATDAIITIDAEQCIVLFNLAASRIFRYSAVDVIGRPLDMLIPERFRPKHRRFVEDFGRTGFMSKAMTSRGELWGLRADGQEFPIEALISQAEVGGKKFYTVILRDISERKRAEEALKMHTRVLESMIEGVNVSDEQGYIHFTNPAFDAMFGYEPGELIGQHVSILEINEPGAKTQFVDEIVAALETEGVWFGEFRNRRKDGAPFITYARVSLLEMPDRRYRVSVQEDITERRKAEQEKGRLFEAINRQREQLRALTRRLTEIQEAERKQLARELHDQVGQNLTALGLNLNIIRAQIPGSIDSVELLYNRIDDSLMLTEQTTERIRDVMANLRPPVLDDYGLVAALNWYGKRFSSWGGFEVSVEGEELKPRLNASIENALFRITQEALTNVAKHACAHEVTIQVDEYDGIVCLVISDDGIGFDNTFLSQPVEKRGWGLLSMIERAEAIGGHCQIDSKPGQGTQITVEAAR